MIRDAIKLDELIRGAVETVVPANKYSRLLVSPGVDADGDMIVNIEVHYPDLSFRATPDVRYATTRAIIAALFEAGDDRRVFVSHAYDIDDESRAKTARAEHRRMSGE
jgi:hypothetical protein